MDGLLTFSLVTSPILTLGSNLVNPNVFIILCRLSLSSTKVTFSGSVMQIPIVVGFNFYLMIYAHVPVCLMANTLPLTVIVNLGTEILPFDINILHHFPNEFAPLAILPPLFEVRQLNILGEESVELFVEENDESWMKLV